MSERESFTSSISRTKGAERIANEDADRSTWLDDYLARERANDGRFALRVIQGGLAEKRRSHHRIGIRGPTRRPRTIPEEVT